MSASNYTLGYGSTISIAPIAGGTVGSYVAIAQTVDLNSPASEVGDVNITNNDSPNNTKESVPGMIEPGDLEFEVVYVKAQFQTLAGYRGDGNIYSFKETFPDGAVCVFPGYIKKLSLEGKTEDDALKGKITIKLNGKEVWS